MRRTIRRICSSRSSTATYSGPRAGCGNRNTVVTHPAYSETKMLQQNPGLNRPQHVFKHHNASRYFRQERRKGFYSPANCFLRLWRKQGGHAHAAHAFQKASMLALTRHWRSSGLRRRGGRYDAPEPTPGAMAPGFQAIGPYAARRSGPGRPARRA